MVVSSRQHGLQARDDLESKTLPLCGEVFFSPQKHIKIILEVTTMHNRGFHSSFGHHGMGMHGHGPMHSPHMGYHHPSFGMNYYHRPMYNPAPFMFGYRRPYYRSYGFGGGLGLILILLFLARIFMF